MLPSTLAAMKAVKNMLAKKTFSRTVVPLPLVTAQHWGVLE
jgi:hypothetical protein